MRIATCFLIVFSLLLAFVAANPVPARAAAVRKTTTTKKPVVRKTTSTTTRKPTSTVKTTSTTTSIKPTSTKTSTSSTTTSTTTTSTTKSSTTTTSSTATSTPTPVANSGKRGLCFNDPSLTQPFSLSGQGSQVSWAYNWASSPYYQNAHSSTNTINPALRYVPMLWSSASDLTSIWNNNVAIAQSQFGTDSLLAFNEPDVCWGGTACMNVSAAVSAYKTYLQPYAGKLQLGSPAVTNSDPSSGAGTAWLQQFVNQCTGCQIDFIALHFYGDVLNPSAFQTYISNAYAQFKKPIWITEFGTTSGTQAQVLSWLQVVAPWISQQSYIVRAAFFWDAVGDTFLMNNQTSMNAIGRYWNSNAS